MSDHISIISQNIRHLRQNAKLSQEELATALGIKRSNIAAYESKNVEPRLRVVLKIAKQFNVSIKDLISTKIYEQEAYQKFAENGSIKNDGMQIKSTLQENPEIKVFIDKSMKIRQILEGFKAFYLFKRKDVDKNDHDKQKLIYDIENFIELMEHLMSYNEGVISAITKVKNQQTA